LQFPELAKAIEDAFRARNDRTGAKVAVIMNSKFKELQKLLQTLQQKADDRSYNAVT
jgi:argininosuccinate lyase